MGGSLGVRRDGPGTLAWDSEEEYERQRTELRRKLSSAEPMSPDSAPTDHVTRVPDPAPTNRIMLTPEAIHPPGSGDLTAPPLDGPDVPTPQPRSGDTSLREPPPPDHTLQLLPGRLEIIRGPGTGEEIRFVRIPGVKQEVTLGRLEGPPHRHVQLKSQTVSRTHARLAYTDGIWTLHNEASTNPTVHNGRALSSMLEVIPLHDGDEIEVGEVTLVFRQGTPRAGLPARSSWYTDRGRRSVNQDAVVVRTLSDGRELAAVCDGMGSHSEGGVASHIALEALVAALSGGSRLRDAVEKANQAVLDAAARAPEREGMGTTLVAMLRDGNDYEIANVGDSRAYRISGSDIQQVSQDHSFVAEAVQAGRMSMEEAQQSPWKTAVTRSLGAEAAVEVDIFRGFDATDPSIVLLCTDGVHGLLGAEDIMDLVARTPDIRDVARVIAEEALLRGGNDNVAAAALRFGVAPEQRAASA